MAQFSYKARRPSGDVVKGVLDVDDRGAALIQIERSGLQPISLKAAKKRSGDLSSALPTFLRSILNCQRKPKLQELATWTQQLANLIHSGKPLTLALDSMGHLKSKGIEQEVSRQLRQDVTEGKSLSEAMAKQSRIFSDLYVTMIKAGEQRGALEKVLHRLAAHFKLFAEVRQKFISALTYSAVVAGVGVAIIILSMTVILPKFTNVIGELAVTLPQSTQILINVSKFIVNWWLVFPLIPLLLTIFYCRFSATEFGRQYLDRRKISLPLLGNVIQLNLFGQFARTLSTLLHSGVPLLTALQITEKIMPNVIVKKAIKQTREGVTDGKTLAQPLARSRFFPQLMIDHIQIGEKTGDIPGSLQRVAETYENELTVTLRVMTNFMVPAMIILVAIGLLGLVLSILWAMLQIT